MRDGRKDSYCITTDSSDNAFIPRLPFQVFFFLVRLMFPFAFEFIPFIFKSRSNLRKLKSRENTGFFPYFFFWWGKKKSPVILSKLFIKDFIPLPLNVNRYVWHMCVCVFLESMLFKIHWGASNRYCSVLMKSIIVCPWLDTQNKDNETCQMSKNL